MKKVLSMVAALLLCVGTQAQIVSSRSAIVKTEKQASSTQWFLRAGLNIMNFSGDGGEGADSNIGYNATFGYQKPLGSTGGYWGMEFGLGSRGFKVDDTKCMAHNIQYSPFTFGWKFAVADNVRIDPHVGVFASYDYTSKMKEDGESISSCTELKRKLVRLPLSDSYLFSCASCPSMAERPCLPKVLL